MNNNDDMQRIWKDVLFIKLGHFLSSFLEKAEENKKIRTSGVPVTISTIQLYRSEAAHTVQDEFVIISGLMLRTVMRR